MPDNIGKVARVVGADGKGRAQRDELGKMHRHAGEGAPPCDCCCADCYCGHCATNVFCTWGVTPVGITETMACTPPVSTDPGNPWSLVNSYFDRTRCHYKSTLAQTGSPVYCQFARYDVLMIQYDNGCDGIEVQDIGGLYRSEIRIGPPPTGHSDPTATAIYYDMFRVETPFGQEGTERMFLCCLGGVEDTTLIPGNRCHDRYGVYTVCQDNENPLALGRALTAQDGCVEIRPCCVCPTCGDMYALLPTAVSVSLLRDAGIGNHYSAPGGYTLINPTPMGIDPDGLCRYTSELTWLGPDGVTEYPGWATLEYGHTYTLEGHERKFWRLRLERYPVGYTSAEQIAADHYLFMECDASPIGGYFDVDFLPENEIVPDPGFYAFIT